MQQIALWWFNYRLRRAIDKAKRMKLSSNRQSQLLVFYVKGRFKLYYRKDLKNAIQRGGVFRPGTTIQEIEKSAYAKI